VATKKDLERLLKKSSLSGLEAARLIIGHHVEQDHARPGFLSEREINYIKSRLTSGAAAEYNRWIDTYRIIDRTLQEAHVLALEIQLGLTVAIREIDRYVVEFLLQEHMRWRPALVTEKQYQEVKTRQREAKLQELYTLGNVLEWSAPEPDASDSEDGWEEAEEEGLLLDFLAERYPELHRQAIETTLELMEAGTLQPVQLEQQDIKRLESLEEQRSQLQRKLYEASKRKQNKASRARLVRALQQLLEGTLSKEEREQLLDSTLCSAAELYTVGIPWLVRDIDEFTPGYLEGEARSYAIVQDQRLFPGRIDEQGNFRLPYGDILEVISGLEVMEQQWKKQGFSGAEVIHQGINKKIRSQLRNYLGLQSIVETVSDILGVDFAEDLRAWHGQIERDVELYNQNIQPDSGYAKDIPKLRKLRIDNLKPSAASLRYFRERIALGLGEGWQEAAMNLWADEAELEEEEPEEVASGQEA
jgi:hypothetical protein